MKPDAGRLGNWLMSWVQEDGAIHGFHNHSVWGANPYRYLDFTCGHSTWASPMLPAICLVLQQQRDAELERKLLRMIRFQTERFQPDGQYMHIGFQMGETLKLGLIHNMMPNVALGLTAQLGASWLPDDAKASIRAAMERSMTACDELYPLPAEQNISNQDYCRIWGKLLYQRVFGDAPWSGKLRGQLDELIEMFHIAGIPDADCIATYRYSWNRTLLEPAEYYGLMIAPLVLAYELFGDERYLRQAGGICRHLARSSWYDARGQKRFHRVYLHTGEQWRMTRTPMLIAGMGMSLYGIHRYLEHREDAELARFLDECDRTYAHYQTPRGYFASGTGWQNEADIAPASTWHAHDWLYLLTRHGAAGGIGAPRPDDDERVSVLLGDQCMWVEKGVHWAVGDYFWQDVHKLLGRKDEAVFGRDMDWVGGPRALPAKYDFPERPVFVKTDEGIYLKADEAAAQRIDVSSIASLPYLGRWR